MSGRDYMGIPREKIPWAPTINEDTCTGCGECREICPNDVYQLDEASGKMKVARPQNCVVLCDKCASFCPTESIGFPDKAEIRKLVGRLLQEKTGS